MTFRTTAQSLAIVALCLTVAACGNRRHAPSNTSANTTYFNTRDLGPELNEIRAVVMLTTESNRLERFMSLAKRQTLSNSAQAYLVDVATANLNSEGNRLMVLLALIDNPTLADEARSKILLRIDRLELESNRMKVLTRLDETAE